MDTSDPHTVSTRALDEVLEPGAILMVGTGPTVMDARPLTAARVDPQRIDFLVDGREDWVRSLSEGEPALATLSDNRSNVWASLRGSSTTSADPALIDELWSPPASAFFEDGREHSRHHGVLHPRPRGQVVGEPCGAGRIAAVHGACRRRRRGRCR